MIPTDKTSDEELRVEAERLHWRRVAVLKEARGDERWPRLRAQAAAAGCEIREAAWWGSRAGDSAGSGYVIVDRERKVTVLSDDLEQVEQWLADHIVTMKEKNP
jgi:hypothetical protein